MAWASEVSGGGYVNVPTNIGINIQNVSRSGTSVYFEYRAYIYQSTDVYSKNTWALWVEGTQNNVKGTAQSSRGVAYYTGWYGRTVYLGTGTSSTTVSIGVNGHNWSPSQPSGYVELTIQGLPIVGKPSLSNINVSSISDKSVYASFSVTNNNYQVPYSPYIDVGLTNFGNVVATVNSRGSTISGLDPNRTYYIRGNDANDAGRTYTNVASFTTTFNNPGNPGQPYLSYDQTEPIPNANLSISWIAASAGSTPISGYRIRLYKNNIEVDSIDTESANTTYNLGTFESLGFKPGDVVSVDIFAYCKDWNNGKHLSSGGSTAVKGSNVITVASDKYIYVSSDGEDFNKHKMYISVNGENFVEVKKEKFKVIN